MSSLEETESSRPYSISKEERIQIEQLRQSLLLGNDVAAAAALPPDLDTDLNLLRWMRGWKGNIAEASARLRRYVENRRAANLDGADLVDRFLTHPVFRSFSLYFSFSLMSDTINPIDNTLVVVQRLENIDLHQTARVMNCGDFLSNSFLLCEHLLRRILERERASGRPSGLTIIYDLSNFPVWNYLNPNAPAHKIQKLCLALMQDHFCNILHRVYIVNAPTVLTIVLEIVKKFLEPMTREKLVVVSDRETLFKNVHPSVVPGYFGGNYKLSREQVDEYRRGNLPVDPDTCCLIPRPVVGEKDYFVPKQMPVPVKVECLKPKQELSVELKSGGGGSKLWWQFRVNSEVLFGVTWIDEDGNKILVFPRLVVNTPKLPEEGHVTRPETAGASAAGTFILEFKNCSTTWFNLKLEYAAYVDEEKDNDVDNVTA